MTTWVLLSVKKSVALALFGSWESSWHTYIFQLNGRRKDNEIKPNIWVLL